MWRPEDNTWESLFPLPSAEAVSPFFLLCKLSPPTLPASELLQSAPPTLLQEYWDHRAGPDSINQTGHKPTESPLSPWIFVSTVGLLYFSEGQSSLVVIKSLNFCFFGGNFCLSDLEIVLLGAVFLLGFCFFCLFLFCFVLLSSYIITFSVLKGFF